MISVFSVVNVFQITRIEDFFLPYPQRIRQSLRSVHSNERAISKYGGGLTDEPDIATHRLGSTAEPKPNPRIGNPHAINSLSCAKTVKISIFGKKKYFAVLARRRAHPKVARFCHLTPFGIIM